MIETIEREVYGRGLEPRSLAISIGQLTPKVRDYIKSKTYTASNWQKHPVEICLWTANEPSIKDRPLGETAAILDYVTEMQISTFITDFGKDMAMARNLIMEVRKLGLSDVIDFSQRPEEVRAQLEKIKNDRKAVTSAEFNKNIKTPIKKGESPKTSTSKGFGDYTRAPDITETKKTRKIFGSGVRWSRAGITKQTNSPAPIEVAINAHFGSEKRGAVATLGEFTGDLTIRTVNNRIPGYILATTTDPKTSGPVLLVIRNEDIANGKFNLKNRTEFVEGKEVQLKVGEPKQALGGEPLTRTSSRKSQ